MIINVRRSVVLLCAVICVFVTLPHVQAQFDECNYGIVLETDQLYWIDAEVSFFEFCFAHNGGYQHAWLQPSLSASSDTRVWQYRDGFFAITDQPFIITENATPTLIAYQSFFADPLITVDVASGRQITLQDDVLLLDSLADATVDTSEVDVGTLSGRPIWLGNGHIVTVSDNRAVNVVTYEGDILQSVQSTDGGDIVGRAVAISPDGTLMAAAFNLDNQVYVEVFDVVSGESLSVLNHGRNRVDVLAFHPLNLQLASSYNSEVVVWDLQNGGEPLVLRGHSAPLSYLAFGPFGRSLTAAAQDGTATLWANADVDVLQPQRISDLLAVPEDSGASMVLLATATPTPTASATPTPQPTFTPTDAPTNTPMPTATYTATPTATQTPSPRPTNTPRPTSTPQPTATSSLACVGNVTVPPRLIVGQQGYVLTLPPVPNRVRSAPDAQASRIGSIEPGESFIVLEGPVCGDNINWWRVRTNDGLTGWTAEGVSGQYYTSPLFE